MVDAHGKMYGVKVQQPSVDWYLKTVGRVEHLLDVLRGSLKIARESPNRYHTRGAHLRFAFGASHGGGQEVYKRTTKCIQSLMGVTQSNQLPALQFLDIKLGTSYRWNREVLPEWSELDQILSSLPFDKSFRMLTIKVCKRRTYKISQEETASRRVRYRESAENFAEDMVSQLEAQFPSLTGRLRFSVKEY